jgi:hypothetical protein
VLEILQFLEGNFVKKDEKKKFGCERVEALETRGNSGKTLHCFQVLDC